jgi:hypothetical protein
VGNLLRVFCFSRKRWFSLDAEKALTDVAIYDVMATHLPRRLYGTRLHTSRRLLFSSALASAVEGSRPRHTSSEAFALFTAKNTCQRSSAATTRALAARTASSRIVACGRDFFDGSDRHHFFQRAMSSRAKRTPMKLAYHSESPPVPIGVTVICVVADCCAALTGRLACSC